MQRALFKNISNKTNRMRLKIQTEKSRILKNDEQTQLPIRTFTLVFKQAPQPIPIKQGSAQKVRRQSREHVRFKAERSKTLKLPEEEGDKKQLQIRTKKLKQPNRKIINSFSTSKLIRISKMDCQNNQPFEQVSTQETQNNLLLQIIEVLKNKYILFESGVMNYSIKKEDLHLFILFCVAATDLTLTSKSRGIIKKKYSQFAPLHQTLKMLQYQQREPTISSLEIMSLDSNNLSHQYSPSQYVQQLDSTSRKLNDLSEQVEQASQQLKSLKEDKLQILSLMKNIKIELSQQLKEKVDLQTHVYQLKDLSQELQAQISKKKAIAENIFNYLNSDNSKIIEKISIQYKQTQKQMHDYALYLQSSHMASQIGFEPRPFSEIEEVIIDEMKKINRTIIQDIDILPELKEKLMRNFILRAMDKFKSKDLEMAKLNQFKTKCIRTFIQNIRKWLQNWNLKQEYLVNMRKQFIYDSERLTDKIKQLRKLVFQGSPSQKSSLVDDLQGISEKIIENYKLGNSFY